METHHDIPSITCYPSPIRSLDALSNEVLEDSRGAVYLLNSDGTVPSPDIETKVRVYWNAQFFFAVFQGRFLELRTAHSQPIDPKTGKTFSLWEHSDVYEMFIGMNTRAQRRYKEFQVGPDSRRLDIDVDSRNNDVRGDFKWLSGFRCKSLVDKSKSEWDCVMEIPWKAFDANYETQGEWNVNFCRASGRFHGDELLSWSPMGRGAKIFHQPGKFGRIVFQR
jgi:hypothetical protein